jgi:hypothetical protein
MPKRRIAMHAGKGYTLECPEAAPPLAHRVHEKRCHEETDSQANSNLNHRSCDVKDNGVEAVGRCLWHDQHMSLDDRKDLLTSPAEPAPLMSADAV